jgi:DUF438 domain-containing protein
MRKYGEHDIEEYGWTEGDSPIYIPYWTVTEENYMEALDNARDIAMMGPIYLETGDNVMQIVMLLERVIEIMNNKGIK